MNDRPATPPANASPVARPPIRAAGGSRPLERPLSPTPPEISAFFRRYDSVATPPIPPLGRSAPQAAATGGLLGISPVPPIRETHASSHLYREPLPARLSGHWLLAGLTGLAIIIILAAVTTFWSSGSPTNSIASSAPSARASLLNPTTAGNHEAWSLSVQPEPGALLVRVAADSATPWISEAQVEIGWAGGFVRFAVPISGVGGEYRLVVGQAGSPGALLVPGSLVRVRLVGNSQFVTLVVPAIAPTPALSPDQRSSALPFASATPQVATSAPSVHPTPQTRGWRP